MNTADNPSFPLTQAAIEQFASQGLKGDELIDTLTQVLSIEGEMQGLSPLPGAMTAAEMEAVYDSHFVQG